jgi:hypothetical protein
LIAKDNVDLKDNYCYLVRQILFNLKGNFPFESDLITKSNDFTSIPVIVCTSELKAFNENQTYYSSPFIIPGRSQYTGF